MKAVYTNNPESCRQDSVFQEAHDSPFALRTFKNQSGDMVYFNFSYKKKDAYDYLITKCDNSILEALLTYLVLENAAK